MFTAFIVFIKNIYVCQFTLHYLMLTDATFDLKVLVNFEINKNINKSEINALEVFLIVSSCQLM